jgi:hypothetical protein
LIIPFALSEPGGSRLSCWRAGQWVVICILYLSRAICKGTELMMDVVYTRSPAMSRDFGKFPENS